MHSLYNFPQVRVDPTVNIYQELNNELSIFYKVSKTKYMIKYCVCVNITYTFDLIV